MRTIHRIGIGLLVGLCFAVGFEARVNTAAREAEMTRAVQQTPVSAPGTSVASAGLGSSGNIDLRPLETLLMVLKSLREHYVEPISSADESKMTYDSLRAMMGALDDPNSRFIDADQRKLITEAADGTFHGIGAMLGVKRITAGSITDEHLVVIAPIESGPAAKAGLQAGDEIIALNAKSVLPFNPYQKAGEMIKAEWKKKDVKPKDVRKHAEAEQDRIDKGVPILEAERTLVSADKDPVELTILRKGSAKEIKIRVTPRQFEVVPVTSAVIDDGDLGYLKIICLCKKTPELVNSTLEDFRAKGVRGLVLDLRDLAGGDAEIAKALARPFLGGKPLAMELKSRGRRSAIRVPEAEPGQSWQGPMVALVNGGTARMPEVVAAALKTDGVAKLVGQKTYGDLSQSTLIDQRDGSAIILTTGMYISPKGVDYNGRGVPVDVETAAAQSGDAQLKEAIRLLNSHGGKG